MPSLRTCWSLYRTALRTVFRLCWEVFLHGWAATAPRYGLTYPRPPQGVALSGGRGMLYPSGPGIPAGTVYLPDGEGSGMICGRDGALRNLSREAAAHILTLQCRGHRWRAAMYVLAAGTYLLPVVLLLAWLTCR